ncbi:deoxyribodipyrimidine photo-lyase [Persicobacter sp. CCB-QB2]|uniref:cryptochrome/photolyase family protein n=1 Tax=Persicobacter sp. CCB-QB2 TaxID=1561025 RepID=UPI0006A9B2D0|nr:deoxyribodipyrimidine photo-lyase [Persicobacter sp. CCB-QB2]
MEKVNIFWFRRDLRLHDNHGFFQALKAGESVVPVFIFDRQILDELPEDDPRITFIYEQLEHLQKQLPQGDLMEFFYDAPRAAFEKLLDHYEVKAVYTNDDYEPYATKRDGELADFFASQGISFHAFKDHVIFEKLEVVKPDGTPYKVFTPYKKVWLEQFRQHPPTNYPSETLLDQLFQGTAQFPMPKLEEMGFSGEGLSIPDKKVADHRLIEYGDKRDFPAIEGTTRLGVHLRFGTISIRQLALRAKPFSDVYLSELIWREFYMMILFNFPHVVDKAFKPQYDQVPWRNDPKAFELWCKGETGFPMVDAGMRELNATGYMHNRVRMVVASFLTKHLLIDWRWGEAYFAEKLLDYELASNNGGWQWAAGTGTDAQPYFRVFNPESQLKKFDPQLEYVKKWVPEYGTVGYVAPMVDHKFARQRAIDTYKTALA